MLECLDYSSSASECNNLEKEVWLGREVGLLDGRIYDRVQVIRFGLVFQNHQPGKWCQYIQRTDGGWE